MTRKRLERTVWEWQKRLGLTTWDIKVNLDAPCHSDADATTWRSNTYERAEIRFDSDWPKWTVAFTNIIVVHELVHLLTRDIEESFKLASLGEEAATKVQDRETEKLVDKLAYRFVELAGLV